MGINTDLSQPPYFDDFDETKQFNRILFKPSFAVQTRELNQLQSILQNQVERFGSNIYKEGTIISGINFTQVDDLFYVKVNDGLDIPDPTAFIPSDGIKYFLRSASTGLNAEIIFAQNGFETRDPDLKTFYILYTNSGVDANGEEVKQFLANDELSILDNKGNAQSFTATVSNVSKFAGRSFGVSCTEGVIYQKGHFIFVEEQFNIVSKYSETPRDVSVGFNVSENIINAGLDNSLYDNAQGFNNATAPGADRFQLKPKLSVFDSGEEPEQFFSIIRYENGEPIQIHNITQFNSIATEMATRTFEESGDYTVRGLRPSLEQETENGETKTYVKISTGKAYIQGYAVETFTPKYLEILPETATTTKSGELTGVDFGGYFTFDATNASALNEFLNDGTRYSGYNGNGVEVITFAVRTIEVNDNNGRIYVYNIDRPTIAPTETFNIARLETTPLTNRGKYFKPTLTTNIFDAGKDNIKSVALNSFIRRASIEYNTDDPNIASEMTKTITRNDERIPVEDITTIFAVGTDNLVYKPISVLRTTEGNLEIAFPAPAESAAIARVYYNEQRTNISPDSLEELNTFVVYNKPKRKSTIELGIPNVVKLHSVIEELADGSDPIDRTSEFKLVTNAKSTHYDYSYLEPVADVDVTTAITEIKPDSRIVVNFTALRRVSTVGNGFLSAVSYSELKGEYVIPYEGPDGYVYDPMKSIDFRPYAKPIVSYAPAASVAETVSDTLLALKQIIAGIQPARDTNIETSQEYYLSRMDTITLDSQGQFAIVSGSPEENPSVPATKDMFVLADVFVPGESMLLTGPDPIRVTGRAPKNYTMKEIEQIDKRLNALTETVSLNLLEKKSNDMFIPNEFGFNRFKNGIIVDNFKTFNVSAISDNEFRSAVDRNKGINMPAITQFPLEMDLVTDNGSGTYEKFDGVVTLPTTGTNVPVITQPFATRSRNAVSNFYKFNANVFIDPEFDAGYNVTQNPAVNLDIDLATPFQEFTEQLQRFVPLTSTQRQTLTRTTTRNINWLQTRTTTTRTTTTTERGFNVDSTEQEQNVGNFVSDIGFNPYMRARDIKIFATGLRPDTFHHLFFNEELMDEFFVPGAIPADGEPTPRAVTASGQPSVKGVKSDSVGNLTAIFRMPENKFFVGEGKIFITDINEYVESDSAATSFGRKTYRAYSFDVEKTGLTATTRLPEFNEFANVTTTRRVTTRTAWRFRWWGGDPLAQTFFIKQEMANGADCIYFKELDLYFRGQDPDNLTMADVTDKGVNIELREVINGYPSSVVLPFGRKHLKPEQVFVSEDSSVVTRINFDDPIKLNIEKEYAFVIKPDGNDPNYLVWTSKVGGTDKTSELAVTQDWGDGVLFTSTNNRAWKSYQDEDIKFTLKRAVFNKSGDVQFRPKSVEFFSIEDHVGSFKSDEIVYVRTGIEYGSSIDTTIRDNSRLDVTLASASVFAIQTNDMIRMRRGTATNEEAFFAKVLEVTTIGGTRRLRLDASPNWTTNGVINIELIKAGRVTYFNARQPNKLYLSESSVRSDLYFEAGNKIIGEQSGATATIKSVDDTVLSYFQPNFYTDNTTNTSTSLKLVNTETGLQRAIPANQEVYSTNNKNIIYSQSNIANGTHADQAFRIIIDMDNNGKNAVTPIIDNDLKIINAYQYQINEQETTSSRYVAKEVVLQEDLDAVGLKVLLTAFRPKGTNIQAYARFKYPTNNENFSSWVELDPASKKVFSNAANVTDYREFEFNLDEERPSQSVNWSAIYDDMNGIVNGRLVSGTFFDWLTQTVDGTYQRMDINNDGSRTADDSVLLRDYGLTISIPEERKLWIETHIGDVLDEIDPTAPDNEIEATLASRYINTVSADEEFNAFQVKLVYTNDPGVDINIFPHVVDFRAIALT